MVTEDKMEGNAWEKAKIARSKLHGGSGVSKLRRKDENETEEKEKLQG
jgi:hypothetical protein